MGLSFCVHILSNHVFDDFQMKVYFKKVSFSMNTENGCLIFWEFWEIDTFLCVFICRILNELTDLSKTNTNEKVLVKCSRY